MIGKIVLWAGLFISCIADRDDKKWVWNDNSQSSNSRTGLFLKDPESRYNVVEKIDDYRPVNGNQYFPSNQPVAINQRPPPIYQNGSPVYQNQPPVSGVGFLPVERPGGVYGNGNYPSYGGQSSYYPEGQNSGILTGPVPSWVREGPIKDFDKCKCTEKFNCNSPGISYGHCDTGKQYCCYSTKKQIGGPISSKPVHSIENGILVGPGGPSDPIPGITAYPRPPKQVGSGFYRPGGFGAQRPAGGNFYNGRPEPNEYSPANGILVGPGGPYDVPNSGFARSSRNSNGKSTS